jgi:hypothetical protein
MEATNDHTTKRYPPVGRCIYCGVSYDLREEHIVPFSLGGVLILPKASCRKCENITHRFEYTCARQVFGKLTVRHNLATP